MSILVTGGAGYIGSATVEFLQARGEQVVVLDDLARGHRAAVASGVPFYHGNVGDRALIARIASEHKIESCIHFAALAYVGESVTDPAMYYENNVTNGVALIGALVQAGVRRFVFSSTCATYGEPKQVPIPETCPQWPKNPYGWSKLLLERVLESYDTAYGLKFVALRYFNAAGATGQHGEHHDPETHLIGTLLQAALGNVKEVPLYGDDYATPDGTAIRDYVHVLDLAQAHERALQHLRQGGASDFFNLGTGDGYSVLEVIECVRKVTGSEIKIRREQRRPGDPTKLVADASKAHQVLGWKPTQSDLEAIIRTAWNWQQQYPSGYPNQSS
jgi:UDP-glucose 4-epimerase